MTLVMLFVSISSFTFTSASDEKEDIYTDYVTSNICYVVSHASLVGFSTLQFYALGKAIKGFGFSNVSSFILKYALLGLLVSFFSIAIIVLVDIFYIPSSQKEEKEIDELKKYLHRTSAFFLPFIANLWLIYQQSFKVYVYSILASFIPFIIIESIVYYLEQKDLAAQEHEENIKKEYNAVVSYLLKELKDLEGKLNNIEYSNKIAEYIGDAARTYKNIKGALQELLDDEDNDEKKKKNK